MFLFFRITDVQDFVARCQRTCPPFILTTSLPVRVLSDKELSLEEADLANAVIVQRPLNTQAPFGHSWPNGHTLLSDWTFNIYTDWKLKAVCNSLPIDSAAPPTHTHIIFTLIKICIMYQLTLHSSNEHFFLSSGGQYLPVDIFLVKKKKKKKNWQDRQVHMFIHLFVYFTYRIPNLTPFHRQTHQHHF